MEPGSTFERSNALFEEARQTIPLASQTFSKSYQQWPKGVAPLFLTHGRGARVFDVDGNAYIDYLQGLMANILGYCDDDVDAAIGDQLERGISFSLPTPIEHALAERLIRLVPCAEMVRFAKNGSDATTAAVRLARAVTGRDKVAMCGYHGWHDWYIGATTRSLGVPAAVQDLAATFTFNDADEIETMLSSDPDGYAAVVLEPAGGQAPEPGFLQRLRALTERFGVILVFDEMVTGFRIHNGGAQAYFGVTPDLACFGKAMANGMPLSALTGRREIMQTVADIFFSGTSGGETLSIAAAIATIDKIERLGVVDRLWTLGSMLQRECNARLEQNGFGGLLTYRGDGWWPRLAITDPPVDPVLLTSLLRQEFVAQGLLLATGLNLCLPHDDHANIEQTLLRFDRAVGRLRDHLDSADPSACLRGDLVQPTFSVRPAR